MRMQYMRLIYQGRADLRAGYGGSVMTTFKNQGLIQMKQIAIVAALTVIGGAAALAQGAPPGLAPWHSGWPSFIETQQMQATSAGRASTSHPASRTEAPRSGSVPVASNVQSNRRGS